MILGRPTTLWVGVVTALAGLVTAVAVFVFKVDPLIVAQLVGPAVTLLGTLIALIAGQAPTLAPGDKYSIVTPKGQPNYEAVVAPPPLPTKPVPEPGP